MTRRNTLILESDLSPADRRRISDTALHLRSEIADYLRLMDLTDQEHHDPDRTSAQLRVVMFSALIIIAGADGPINPYEAYLLNMIFDEDLSLNAYSDQHARIKSLSIALACTGIFKSCLQLDAFDATPSTWNPYASRSIKLFGALGDAILNADADISSIEAQKLAEITTAIHQLAGVFQPSFLGISAAAPIHATSPTPQAGPSTIEECIGKLHKLVGLASVKKEVESLINLARVIAIRKERGMPIPTVSFHMVFTGNPGTGKTTVARIVAQVFSALGLLPEAKVIETDRSGLVAGYAGQTAIKTKAVIESAIGGVLFIDEAYALARRDGQDSFGQEAIEILLKSMEDRRDELVVIAAGYSAEMEGFVASNPGLRSRFSRTIHFPDYTPADMTAIFEAMARDHGYELTQEGREALSSLFNRVWSNRMKTFANGRDVRNLFERLMSIQADRLAAAGRVDDQSLVAITAADVLQLSTPTLSHAAPS